jgi:predicted nucleic acid-binding protein
MGQGYLADTNTIIDYLENKLPGTTNSLLDNITIQISVISRIELLVWKKASDKQLQILTGFINASTIFDLSETIILKTIEVRRNYGLKLPDAIIAATSIANNLTLLTRNLKDFEKVTSLQCVDPYHL